jgi:hypothetical protein
MDSETIDKRLSRIEIVLELEPIFNDPRPYGPRRTVWRAIDEMSRALRRPFSRKIDERRLRQSLAGMGYSPRDANNFLECLREAMETDE